MKAPSQPQWSCDPNCPPENESKSKKWFNRLESDTKTQLITCLKTAREDQAATRVAETLHDRSEEIKGSTFRKLTELRQAGAKIPPVACQMGCNYCCHLQVCCYPPETIRIADHLRKTRTPKQLAEIVAKMRRHSAFRAKLSKKERADSNVSPCPFLGGKGECTIYEVRPLVCRTYHSFKLEDCERAFHNPEKRCKVTMVLEPCDTRDALSYALEAACDKMKIPSHEVELVDGVLVALQHPDASKLWKQGVDLFAKARI